MTATPVRASRPLWTDARRERGLPPLTGRTKCGVVVLGAGIVGLTTALEPARCGLTGR